MSRRRTREDVGTRAPTVRRKPPVVVAPPKKKITKPKTTKKATKERKTSKQRREERAAAQKAAEKAAERAAAQKAAQERLMREATKITQKRDELKEVRTKQAAISTEVHLLERKGEAIEGLDITTSAEADRAIQMIERYKEMADGVIDHGTQIRDKIQSDYDKAEAAKSSVVANREDYTTESYEEFLDNFSTFERESLDTIENYDNFIESVEDAKETGTNNIANIEGWKSDVARQIQESRLSRSRRGFRAKIPGKTTVTWTEGGEEKQAVFDKPEQAERFVERRKRRGQLAEIRTTGAPPEFVPERTGPLAPIMRKLDQVKEKYLKKADMPPEAWKADSYLGYLMKTRTRGFAEAPPKLTREQIIGRLGWIGTTSALSAIRSAPVVAGTVPGILLGSSLGMIFVPAAIAFALDPDKSSHLEYLMKTRTRTGMVPEWKQYLITHPEAYTEMVIQGLTTLALTYGVQRGLQRFFGPRTKQMEMTPEQYHLYRKEHPWAGGREARLIIDPDEEGWMLTELVQSVVEKAKPEWRKWDIGRAKRGISRHKPYHWVAKVASAIEEDKVFPTIDIPGVGKKDMIWVNFLAVPGVVDEVREGLRARGFTDVEIDRMVPTMDDLASIGKIDFKILTFPTIDDMNQHFLQSPNLDLLMKLGLDFQQHLDPVEDVDSLLEDLAEQEMIHEELEIQEPIPEPTPVPPIPDLKLPPLLEPALLRPRILRDKKRKPGRRRGRGRPRDMGTRLPTKRIRYSPKPEPYRADFGYTGGRGETHLVEARSFPEAHSKAYEMKRIEEKPTLTEIERILHGEPLHEELLIEESLFGESNPGNPKNKTKKLKKKPKRERRPGPPPGTKPGPPPGKKKTTPKTRTSGGKERHKKEEEEARRRRRPRRRSRVVGVR